MAAREKKLAGSKQPGSHKDAESSKTSLTVSSIKKLNSLADAKKDILKLSEDVEATTKKPGPGTYVRQRKNSVASVAASEPGFGVLSGRNLHSAKVNPRVVAKKSGIGSGRNSRTGPDLHLLNGLTGFKSHYETRSEVKGLRNGKRLSTIGMIECAERPLEYIIKKRRVTVGQVSSGSVPTSANTTPSQTPPGTPSAKSAPSSDTTQQRNLAHELSKNPPLITFDSPSQFLRPSIDTIGGPVGSSSNSKTSNKGVNIGSASAVGVDGPDPVLGRSISSKITALIKRSKATAILQKFTEMRAERKAAEAAAQQQAKVSGDEKPLDTNSNLCTGKMKPNDGLDKDSSMGTRNLVPKKTATEMKKTPNTCDEKPVKTDSRNVSHAPATVQDTKPSQFLVAPHAANTKNVSPNVKSKQKENTPVLADSIRSTPVKSKSSSSKAASGTVKSYDLEPEGEAGELSFPPEGRVRPGMPRPDTPRPRFSRSPVERSRKLAVRRLQISEGLGVPLGGTAVPPGKTAAGLRVTRKRTATAAGSLEEAGRKAKRRRLAAVALSNLKAARGRKRLMMPAPSTAIKRPRGRPRIRPRTPPTSPKREKPVSSDTGKKHSDDSSKRRLPKEEIKVKRDSMHEALDNSAITGAKSEKSLNGEVSNGKAFVHTLQNRLLKYPDDAKDDIKELQNTTDSTCQNRLLKFPDDAKDDIKGLQNTTDSTSQFQLSLNELKRHYSGNLKSPKENVNDACDVVSVCTKEERVKEQSAETKLLKQAVNTAKDLFVCSLQGDGEMRLVIDESSLLQEKETVSCNKFPKTKDNSDVDCTKPVSEEITVAKEIPDMTVGALKVPPVNTINKVKQTESITVDANTAVSTINNMKINTGCDVEVLTSCASDTKDISNTGVKSTNIDSVSVTKEFVTREAVKDSGSAVNTVNCDSNTITYPETPEAKKNLTLAKSDNIEENIPNIEDEDCSAEVEELNGIDCCESLRTVLTESRNTNMPKAKQQSENNTKKTGDISVHEKTKPLVPCRVQTTRPVNNSVKMGHQYKLKNRIAARRINRRRSLDPSHKQKFLYRDRTGEMKDHRKRSLSEGSRLRLHQKAEQSVKTLNPTTAEPTNVRLELPQQSSQPTPEEPSEERSNHSDVNLDSVPVNESPQKIDKQVESVDFLTKNSGERLEEAMNSGKGSNVNDDPSLSRKTGGQAGSTTNSGKGSKVSTNDTSSVGASPSKKTGGPPEEMKNGRNALNMKINDSFASRTLCYSPELAPIDSLLNLKTFDMADVEDMAECSHKAMAENSLMSIDEDLSMLTPTDTGMKDRFVFDKCEEASDNYVDTDSSAAQLKVLGSSEYETLNTASESSDSSHLLNLDSAEDTRDTTVEMETADSEQNVEEHFVGAQILCTPAELSTERFLTHKAAVEDSEQAKKQDVSDIQCVLEELLDLIDKSEIMPNKEDLSEVREAPTAQTARSEQLQEATPEEQAEKVSILWALGLRQAKLPSPPLPKSAPYTGTLKTVIKVQRTSPEKRRRSLKMVLKQGSASNGAAQSDSGEEKIEYRICKENELLSNDSSNTTVNNRKLIKNSSHRSFHELSTNSPFVAGGKEEAPGATVSAANAEGLTSGATNKEDATAAKTEVDLIIPEKSASFSIHPGRLCSDVCSYCFGKFGSLDTPCHIAQLKTAERQRKVLEIETHLTAESCLCDACYRHVDRKANCPSYKESRKRYHRTGNNIGNSNAICSAQGCDQPAYHHVRRKWLLKLKRSIMKKVPVDIEKPQAHFPLCAQHFSSVDFYMVCGICNRRLARAHMYGLGSAEARELNAALTRDGIPARVTAERFLCKLCRYYASLRSKCRNPNNLTGNQKMFFDSYRKRILQYHDIELPLGSEIEETANSKDSSGAASQPSATATPTAPPKPKRRRTKTDSTATKEAAESQKGGDNSVLADDRDRNAEAASQQSSSAVMMDYSNLATFGNNLTVTPIPAAPGGRRASASSGSHHHGGTEQVPPLHASFEFHGAGGAPRGGGEWEQCTASLQFTANTKRLFQTLQRPYGSHSSFMRHLVLMEKYWRQGELVLSPRASNRTATYVTSVQQRLRAFDYTPLQSGTRVQQKHAAGASVPESGRRSVVPETNSVSVIPMGASGEPEPQILEIPLRSPPTIGPPLAVQGPHILSRSPVCPPGVRKVVLEGKAANTAGGYMLSVGRGGVLVPTSVMQVGGRTYLYTPTSATTARRVGIPVCTTVAATTTRVVTSPSASTTSSGVPRISSVRSLAPRAWDRTTNTSTATTNTGSAVTATTTTAVSAAVTTVAIPGKSSQPRVSVTVVPKSGTSSAPLPKGSVPGPKPSTIVTPTGIVLSRSLDVTMSPVPMQ